MKKHWSWLAVSLLMGVWGCSSSKDDSSEDLDVAPIKTTGENAGPVFPGPEVVLDWQQFFKPAPADKERTALEEKVAGWTDNSNVPQMVSRARAEVVLGRLAAAEATYRQVIRLSPESIDANLELAQLFLRKKNFQNAFEFLEVSKKLIENTEKPSPVIITRYRYALALGYIGRNERDKGHAILSDLISNTNDFSPAYAAMASSYIKQGKHSAAEFIARRGLDRGKPDPSLYNILGVVEESRGRPTNARSMYDKALELAPAYVPAIVNRASVAAKNGENSAAEQDLNAALRIDPNNVAALVALGVVQQRAGRHLAAKASFSKAIDTDPDHAGARFNLGVLMADHLNNANGAKRLFYEVLQTPDDNRELKELARLYIDDMQDAYDSEPK